MLVIPDGHIGGDATSADIEPRGSVVISENVAIPNDTPPGIADIDSDAQTIATMADLGTSLPGTSQSENPLSSPLPTDVEPDNDVDAETGEPIANVQAPAQGSTGGGDEAGLSSNLPAPLGPSVAPDNDVAVE